MSPTQYLKRAWFWVGLGTGALVLTGLVTWLWKTRLHGANIQPVRIDFSFVRHPSEVARAAAPIAPPAAPPETSPIVEKAAPAAPPEAAPATDDLTLLVGIGPRIAAVLQQAGVSSFAQLAEAEPTWLRELLQAQKLRLADPESWPAQARLAAAGKWEELKQAAAQARAARGSA